MDRVNWASADIGATGRLMIGVNVPYAPNEFKDTNREIVGFDRRPRRQRSS
jgi:hypothetical protein